MKKTIAAFLAVCMMLSLVTGAFAEGVVTDEFKITAEGEVLEYYGDEWVAIPNEVGGIEVVSIGEKAFFDLGIMDVYLPEGIMSIGALAFEGCNTISASIPSTTRFIGDMAFANCRWLRTVYIDFDENIEIGKDAFSGTGFLVFYVRCDADLKVLDQKLSAAKRDTNFVLQVRHVSPEYDSEGRVLCPKCGFYEDYVYELPFEDVSIDDWYYDSVLSMYNQNIINGKSETVFDPDAGMTCAEAAKIAATIYSLSHGDIPKGPADTWYQPYVDYCYDNGIIAENVVFDWNALITRGQMAYMFYRCDYRDIRLNDVPITDIPDVNDKTPFAYEILGLYNKGVAVGDENMSYYPDSNIKRCEAAAIAARILNWDMRVELPKG